MKPDFLKHLYDARSTLVQKDASQKRYRLVHFEGTGMDFISGTPFRTFEAVPVCRPSRRMQNNTMSFDPYSHTLFDYPLVVQHLLKSQEDPLIHHNWQLTVQIPSCPLNCWHCYNPKTICPQGHTTLVESDHFYSAKELLEEFAECKKAGKQRGRNYNILRVSGGEPFLLADLILELLQLIAGDSPNPDWPKALWTESNLTPFIPFEGDKCFIDSISDNLLSQLSSCKAKLIVHPCFHGTTDRNIESSTDCSGLSFRELKVGFTKLHSVFSTGHIFPSFVTDGCDPDGVVELFRFLKGLSTAYPLKTALIPADFYEAVTARMQQENRRFSFRMYPHHAALRRWDDLLREEYGLSYGQTVRPLAEAISAAASPSRRPASSASKAFSPALFLIKSIYRSEYRQELLTIAGSPAGTRIQAAYDTRHIDPSLVHKLKAWRHMYKEEGPYDVFLIYADLGGEAEVPYLPIRKGSLARVEVTEHIVQLEIILREYVDLGSNLGDLKNAMMEYFGPASLVVPETRRWVLLGEEAVLSGWGGNSTLRLKRSSDGWDSLLGTIKGCVPSLRDKNIFIQVLVESRQDRESDRPHVIRMGEGTILRVKLRHYIPDFDYYDRNPSNSDDRTIQVVSSSPLLMVQGYDPQPLSKYGETEFEVVCRELTSDVDVSLLIRSKSGTPNCPNIRLEFSLKKAIASECLK